MKATLAAAARPTVKAPARASTAPRAPRVEVVPAPLNTAPRMTKILAMRAARRNETIREATAVPKMLEASFAPVDHPRKRPLRRKNQIKAIRLLL